MANVMLFYVHAQLAASLRLRLRFIGKASAVDIINLICQSSIWFDMAMLLDQDWMYASQPEPVRANRPHYALCSGYSSSRSHAVN